MCTCNWFFSYLQLFVVNKHFKSWVMISADNLERGLWAVLDPPPPKKKKPHQLFWLIFSPSVPTVKSMQVYLFYIENA